MSKFILKLTLLFTFIIFIELILYNYLVGNKIKTYGIHEYNIHDTNFNVYLLADSKGAALDNTLEVKGIYNFSSPGDSYSDMYLKLNFLVNNSKIDTLILTVDDHILSSYRDEKNNSNYSSFYKTYDMYENIFEFLLDKIKHRSLILSPSKSYALRTYIISNISQLLQSNNGKKKQWYNLSKDEKNKIATSRIDYQFKDRQLSLVQVEFLRKMINLCNSNSITLIGIKFPLTYEYILAQGNNSFKADSTLIKMRLDILDYSKVFIESPDLFQDEDHLNKKGAHSLKNLISKDIRTL